MHFKFWRHHNEIISQEKELSYRSWFVFSSLSCFQVVMQQWLGVECISFTHSLIPHLDPILVDTSYKEFKACGLKIPSNPTFQQRGYWELLVKVKIICQPSHPLLKNIKAIANDNDCFYNGPKYWWHMSVKSRVYIFIAFTIMILN